MRVVLLGFLLFLAGVCQAASPALTHIQAEKDPAKQIKLLNAFIKKSPKTRKAYHLRGDAYRALGRYKQAVEDYTQTIKLSPNWAFSYYARALVYMDMGRWPSAEADLSRAISLNKSYRDFYLYRARTEMKLSKYNAAIADYKKYWGKRKPTEAGSLALAKAYMGAYKYDNARKELLSLAARTPDDPEVYYMLGRIQQLRGALDEAVSYYSKSINRNPAYAPAWLRRGDTFKEMKDLPAALEDYTALLALETKEAAYYNRRGLVYEEMKDFENAVADYNKAIEINPKWSIPYNNRGYAYLNLKKWNEARQDLENAIKLDESAPTPYVNLAGVYWLSKRDKKNTYQYLEKAIKHNFRNFDALYDEDQKGWMFKDINKTAEFRAIMYR